jgi:hypothetical protein
MRVKPSKFSRKQLRSIKKKLILSNLLGQLGHYKMEEYGIIISGNRFLTGDFL